MRGVAGGRPDHHEASFTVFWGAGGCALGLGDGVGAIARGELVKLILWWGISRSKTHLLLRKLATHHPY
jgi:hypothetical protein